MLTELRRLIAEPTPPSRPVPNRRAYADAQKWWLASLIKQYEHPPYLLTLHTNLTERRLPPWPWRLRIPSAVFFFVLVAITTWLVVCHDWGWPPFVLIFIIGGINWFYVTRRRCPQCRRRLILRPKSIYGTGQCRLFLDCPPCEIAWDTGHTYSPND